MLLILTSINFITSNYSLAPLQTGFLLLPYSEIVFIRITDRLSLQIRRSPWPFCCFIFLCRWEFPCFCILLTLFEMEIGIFTWLPLSSLSWFFHPLLSWSFFLSFPPTLFGQTKKPRGRKRSWRLNWQLLAPRMRIRGGTLRFGTRPWTMLRLKWWNWRKRYLFYIYTRTLISHLVTYTQWFLRIRGAAGSSLLFCFSFSFDSVSYCVNLKHEHIIQN